MFTGNSDPYNWGGGGGGGGGRGSPISGYSQIEVNIYKGTFLLLQGLLVGGEKGSKILTWYHRCLFLGDDPCFEIVGGLIPIKRLRFVKSPATVEVGFKRGWIIMTFYEFHIA